MNNSNEYENYVCSDTWVSENVLNHSDFNFVLRLGSFLSFVPLLVIPHLSIILYPKICVLHVGVCYLNTNVLCN